MFLFVAARTGGRFLSLRILEHRHPDAFTPLEKRNLAASPMGALSIAIVMTAQDLYSGTSVAWIVTAILGGAIVTEFITQVSAFATRKLFPDYSDEPDDEAESAGDAPPAPATEPPAERGAAMDVPEPAEHRGMDTSMADAPVVPGGEESEPPEVAAPGASEPPETGPTSTPATPELTHDDVTGTMADRAATSAPTTAATTPPPLPNTRPDAEV
jgi:hypothetical protein